jgi:hypothetical protein
MAMTRFARRSRFYVVGGRSRSTRAFETRPTCPLAGEEAFPCFVGDLPLTTYHLPPAAEGGPMLTWLMLLPALAAVVVMLIPKRRGN